MALMGPNRTMTVLALIVVFIRSILGVKYRYHIPFACSVVYTNGDLIGPCAIIEDRVVVVSVDAMNGTIAGSRTRKRYFQDITEIYVNAGSNFMDPTKLLPRQKSKYTQVARPYKFYVPFKRPDSNGGKWDFRLDPTDISERAGAEYDVYGLAFGVGFLVLLEPFGRSAYVLPMLIKGPDLPRRTDRYKKKLEYATIPTDTCITYSYSQELNVIRYHEVMYLDSRNCEELFCNWQLSKCRKFPKKDYQMCFKSVKYPDVCPNARGAALYCSGFDNSVFAILTTAPSCGVRRMPGVYTTLPLVIDLFEKVFEVHFEPERRVKYDIFSLPQLNSDYEGIP